PPQNRAGAGLSWHVRCVLIGMVLGNLPVVIYFPGGLSLAARSATSQNAAPTTGAHTAQSETAARIWPAGVRSRRHQARTSPGRSRDISEVEWLSYLASRGLSGRCTWIRSRGWYHFVSLRAAWCLGLYGDRRTV